MFIHSSEWRQIMSIDECPSHASGRQSSTQSANAITPLIPLGRCFMLAGLPLCMTSLSLMKSSLPLPVLDCHLDARVDAIQHSGTAERSRYAAHTILPPRVPSLLQGRHLPHL